MNFLKWLIDVLRNLKDKKEGKKNISKIRLERERRKKPHEEKELNKYMKPYYTTVSIKNKTNKPNEQQALFGFRGNLNSPFYPKQEKSLRSIPPT